MKKNLSLFIKTKTENLNQLKSELELRIKNANDKEYAEILYIEELNSVYQNLQNNLGELSKFNNFIKEKKRLNKNFDETDEYNKLKLDEIKKIAKKEAFKEFLDTHYIIENKKIIIHKTELKWLGNDFLEFIILFRCLQESGIIKDKTQTLLITNIAKLFNYDLSKNWESLLSHNLKKTVENYEPTIISKIRDGYKLLKSRSETRRKKNKKQLTLLK